MAGTKLEYIFGVSHLKRLTQKMSIFRIGYLRQPAQKIEVYFWC
jgi:hypothetical protein